MEATKKYFNYAQQQLMAVAPKDLYAVCSRAFGKSEGIDAPRLLLNMQSMPRSAGAILSPTYAKLLQNTLPAIFHALERLGLKRNIHFFLGRKPPKSFGFQTPYINPFSYDHVLSLYNGSIAHLVSFDRTMSVNSMSLDWINGPEAKFLDFDKVKNEVLPANRGNINYFGHVPWHHGQTYTTDMPTNKSGMWILDKEKDMDRELIELIKITYYHWKILKDTKNRSPYHERKLNQLTNDLVMFRRQALMYVEFNVFDNIDVLGETFIKDMKRDLPPIIFRAAILNERFTKLENGFYPNLDEKIHTYESYDYEYLEKLRTNQYDINLKKTASVDCRHDGDILKNKNLCIAFDYNANINWVITGQEYNNEMRTLGSLYVKNYEKLRALCRKWCDYYQHHAEKTVVYYYNQSAIKSAYADEKAEAFYEIVIAELSNREWIVESVYMGAMMAHNVKHQYIDDALKGIKYLFPKFNKYNNEALLLAMWQTGIKIGRNGWEKDKSGEKEEETPEDLLEFRTDGTDAWDDLFIGMNFFPYKGFSPEGAIKWGG